MGAQGCALVGPPEYYKKFGFRNYPEVIHEGIPQEVFLVLPLTKKCPKELSASMMDLKQKANNSFQRASRLRHAAAEVD